MVADEGTQARRVDDLEALAGAGTWSLDLRTRQPWWSPGQHRLYGTDPGSAPSLEGWAELVHPGDRTMWSDALAAVVEHVEGCAIDHRVVRADDGTTRWLHCRARVDGGALHGVSVDATNQYAVAESVRTFIADAAHELRTPAAAIGQAVSALEVVDDDNRPQVLAVLARQSARLRALTTDLVDLAQLDAAPLAIVLEPVPLASAVAEAVVHAPAPDGHRVTTEVPESLTVVATATRLDRVLVNLLTNAYRYGGPNVAVRARDEGDRIVVEVADDGPGVPPDVVPELFQPFRRGPQRHPEASGIGLAIVDRLVRRFGGEARYRPGEPGAVFQLELERARAT